jgi:hypothetical protein
VEAAMAELLGQRFLKQELITEDQLAKALERQRRHGGRLGENLVALGYAAPGEVEDFFKRTPPAVKSIAETIGNILPGEIFVPYAVLIDSEIITLYDPMTHRSTGEKGTDQDWDQRWVKVKRPMVMVGGELTLKHLDLDFNQVTKFYEAPFQMKANNGLLIIDDFGRQQVEPQYLINRLIIPLERRTDFLTFHTGMKFEIPFDQLVISSTNLDPKDLVDEAFLRRIRYKIKIGHPSREEYSLIFKRMCEANQVEFEQSALDYLIAYYYERLGISLNACHPRDLIDNLVDQAHYAGLPRRLTRETISQSWESYFVEI